MIDIYVHTVDGADPKLVKASEESTIKQLIKQVTGEGADDGSFLLFIEDGEDAVQKHQTLAESEIRHRHHVHIHKCKKVQVSVFYNGQKQETFPPSAKVKRVLKWAVKAFGLSPVEATDKFLALNSDKNAELPMDAHIGSFTADGECSINLCLVAPVEVQG
jgi:hypothetical protein